VRVIEGIGHLPGYRACLLQRKLPLSLETVSQRRAVDVRHDVVEEPAGLARVEKRENVRVIQPCREGDLTKEPLGAKGGGELGPERFQGNGAVVLEIMGQLDRGHPAPSELAVHAVTLGQGSVQPIELVTHLLLPYRRMKLHYSGIGISPAIAQRRLADDS
jgi:hypothetical protein